MSKFQKLEVGTRTLFAQYFVYKSIVGSPQAVAALEVVGCMSMPCRVCYGVYPWSLSTTLHDDDALLILHFSLYYYVLKPSSSR